MPVTSPDVRKQAFAAFVRRATDRAKLNRGLSLPQIAREAGIGVNTLYRWTKADLTAWPEPAKVAQLCRALDIPVEIALEILWPSGEKVPAPAPLPTEPDFEILLRRLNDPTVPDEEKFLIRETIRGLAARSVPPPARRRAG